MGARPGRAFRTAAPMSKARFCEYDPVGGFGCGRAILAGERQTRMKCQACYRRLLRQGLYTGPGRAQPEPEPVVPAGWQHQAACAGLSDWVADELFFPVNETFARMAAVHCRTCPVRQECLEDAARFPETQRSGGVFGGVWFRSRAEEEPLVLV